MKQFLYLLLLLPGLALAGGNHGDPCDHPRFQEVGCTYPGEEGPPGRDGQDGRDGIDGRDGQDGDSAYQVALNNGFEGSETEWLTSLVGRDGRDGRDGVVPTEWINEVRYFNIKYSRYLAASEALQIHLPQDQESRLTFGLGRSASRIGLGVGYAFVNEDGVAFTAGLGVSGGEYVGKASIGFEFGGERGRPRLTATKYKAQLECSYVGGVLAADMKCVKDE